MSRSGGTSTALTPRPDTDATVAARSAERGSELVALLLPLLGWVVAHADDIVRDRG